MKYKILEYGALDITFKQIDIFPCASQCQLLILIFFVLLRSKCYFIE